MRSATLIGRRTALDAARDALERARSGRGRVLVVEGEPGIGKSALAAAVAEWAEAAGATCHWGRAWELGNAPPYFPLRACLRALGVDAEPAASGDGGPFALWERVLDALAQAAAARPQVWIIEDAHAADLLTLDLLAFLAQPVRGLGALIVVTRRDRDPRLTPAAEQRLVRLAREGESVALLRLDAADAATLADQAAGRALDASLHRRLWELTGGNPLFVVECARTLARDQTGASLPATLRQLVQERLEALPAANREVVETAALLGREVSAAALAAVTGRLPARVIDDLAPALRAGLVIERRPGDFAFSHVVVRDAIEDATPASVRADVHARAAAALTDSQSPEAVIERARHTLSALELGTVSTLSTLEGAGGAAGAAAAAAPVTAAIALCSDRGAFDRAFALAERLDAARSGGRLPAASFDERLQVAVLASAASRAAESRRRCEVLIAEAVACGEVAARARATLALGSELRPGVVDEVLVTRLRDALDAIGDRDPAMACRLSARLAAAEQPAPDPGGPVRRAEAAISTARTLGDPAVLCEVLDVAGSALVDYATMERRLEVAGELMAVARARGDRARELRALCRRAMDRAEGGDFAGFAADVDALDRRSLELGDPRFRWRALLMTSMQAMAEGRVVDSERALVEVQQMAAMIDDPALRLSLAAHAGNRARLLHLDDVLRVAAEQVDRDLDGVPGAPYVAAVLRASFFGRLEDLEHTRIELARSSWLSAAFEHDSTFHTLLGEVLALVGEEHEVRRIRTTLAAWPQPEMVGGHIPISYDGPRARVVALLDHRLGDLDAAEQGLRAALESVRAHGHRAWVAQISYELGLLGRDGAAWFERAATLAGELGMSGLAARARARLRSAPVAVTVAAPARRVELTRDGESWTVSDGAAAVRVRDSRGVRMLARLVERPDEEIHVLALAADDEHAALVEGAAPAVMDAEARRAYRERLEDLDEAIERAEATGDARGYDRLAAEKAALAREVGRAMGVGGASRRAGSAAERARINVQRRVKDVIARIGEQDRGLGEYLERAVRTGSYCCFRP